MGDLIDKEPGYNSGWGYCDFSDSCDGRINNTFDSRGIVVSSVFRKIIEYVGRQAFRKSSIMHTSSMSCHTLFNMIFKDFSLKVTYLISSFVEKKIRMQYRNINI